MVFLGTEISFVPAGASKKKIALKSWNDCFPPAAERIAGFHIRFTGHASLSSQKKERGIGLGNDRHCKN